MRIKPVALALALSAPILMSSLAASRAEADCSIAKLAELPVTMVGQRPTVPARINGSPALFFVDTGAFFSFLSPAAAAKFGLKLDPAPVNLTVYGFGGEAREIHITSVRDFAFGESMHHNVDFLVGERGFGGIAGVIGQNVFGSADVEYDLANGVIRLFRPTGCERAVLAYWVGDKPYAMVDIDPTNPREPEAKANATVNGVRVRVEFDTGATSILSLTAAARAGVRPTDPGVTSLGYASGAARRSFTQTWAAPFASFKLGDEEIKDIKLPIGDMKIEGVDMLIGIDFFLSHHVYIANSQHRVYFTYNGGPVFNLNARDTAPTDVSPSAGPAAPAPSVDAPTDAAGFARRAAAAADRKDFASGIADMNRAIEMAPANPSYYYRRGVMELASRQPAMADFDQALKLRPDDIPALLARATLHRARGEPLLAKADLDAAAAAAASQPDRRLGIADAYAWQGFEPEALQQYDLWIDAHPNDDRRALALSDRCWLRAQRNEALDKALADCNAALKLEPGDPAVLNHRGMVYLRQGDFDRAIADYDQGISLKNDAWALYGRGLAKLRKGRTSEGQADIQAATALDPRLPAQAKARGLTP